MKKRILSFVLALLLLSGIFTFPAVNVSATQTDDYDFMASVLSHINILDYKNYSEASNYYLTRGEFAIMAASILKLNENTNYDERYFADVPLDHWAAYAINYLAKAGFVSVGVDKMFRPGDKIGANEALKILLEIAGYGQYALAKGGYPVGYVSVANSLKITRDCYIGDFTYAKAVALVYEIINAPMYEVSRIENGELMYETSEETLLSMYFDMYENEGVVTSIDEISVNDTPSDIKGGVVIDGVHYKTNLDLFDDLGRYLTFIYSKNDYDNYGEVILVNTFHANDKTIEIDAQDFEAFDDKTNYVTYYDENGKEKRIKLASNVSVIKNGTPETENTFLALNSNKGHFRFTDADENGSYEYAFVFEYVNYVVDFINSNSKEIYDTIVKGRKVLFDDDKKIKIYNQQGMPMLFEDIKPRSVVSVLESDMMVNAYVSTNSITATIYETTNENNEFKILAGKNEKDTSWYTIDKDLYEDLFKGKKITANPGMKAVLYTDFYGKVAYIEQVSDDVWQYAYLIDTDNKKQDSNDFRIYVYTQNNSDKFYALSKNVKIDGEVIKEFDKIYPALKKTHFKTLASSEHEVNGQLIRIKINDEGFVVAIDTERSIPQKEGTVNLNRTIDAQKTNYVYGSQCFDGKMVINNKTVIFGVPSHDMLDKANEEDFSVFDVTSMIAKNNLVAEGFKINSESGYEDVVVIYGPEILLEYQYAFYLVENVKRKVSGDDERTVLSAWSNGVLFDLIGAAGYDFTDDNGVNVSEGDLIQIMRNLQGDVYKVDILYDYSKKDDEEYKLAWNIKYTDKYNDYGNALYGYLTKYSDGVMNISFTKPTVEEPYKYDFIAPQNKMVVMIYDSKDKKNPVKFGTESDIIPADRFAGNAKPYFFCTKRGSVVTVIIYK